DSARIWQQDGDVVHIVGYVVIGNEQQVAAGEQVADSYARAELAQFLNTRVVSVLSDVVSSKVSGVFAERIMTESKVLVDDTPIVTRYWEKVNTKEGEAVHVYARLDMDRRTLKRMLEKVVSGSDAITTSLTDIFDALDARWADMADAGARGDIAETVPAGFEIPKWARSGDERNEKKFTFVCKGFGDTKDKAAALAAAQCTEKLCRLFGVMISARTDVSQTMDNLDMTREVSEQCPNVRIYDRQMTHESSECNAKGCIKWMVQTYPLAAYERERLRLDDQVIVEREVVIKEGDRDYRDPEKCEETLTAYGAVKGRTFEALEERRLLLKKAINQCNGIDNRDLGTMTRLTRLLIRPTESFTGAPGDGTPGDDMYDNRKKFFVATKDWFETIEEKSSVSERIYVVLTMLENGRDPLFIIDEAAKKHPDLKEIEAALGRLKKFPIGDEATVETHFINPHATVVLLLRDSIPYMPTYGTWLKEQIEKKPLACYPGHGPGANVLEYLAKGGPLDDGAWQAGIEMIRRSNGTGISCYQALFESPMDKTTRKKRRDDLAAMIVGGKLPHGKFETMINQFETFTAALTATEGLEMFLKWQRSLDTANRAYGKLVEKRFRALLRLDADNPQSVLRWCHSGESELRRLSAAVSADLVPDDVRTFCTCEDREMRSVIGRFDKDRALSDIEQDVMFYAVNKAPAQSNLCFSELDRLRVDDVRKQQLKARLLPAMMNQSSSSPEMRDQSFAAYIEQLPADEQYDHFMTWHEKLNGKKRVIAEKILEALLKLPRDAGEALNACRQRPQKIKRLTAVVPGLESVDADAMCTCANYKAREILSSTTCDGVMGDDGRRYFEYLMTRSESGFKSCAFSYMFSTCMKKLSSQERKQNIEFALRLLDSGKVPAANTFEVYENLLQHMTRDEFHQFFLRMKIPGTARQLSTVANRVIRSFASNDSGSSSAAISAETCETAPLWIEDVLNRYPETEVEPYNVEALCTCFANYQLTDKITSALRKVMQKCPACRECKN
ncbi:MAG: hypothetical protein JXX14_21390, partial [Deltaproteobacteria bacterium]|nr:hypothetical protein [Deltaproteobacteria bacterium]